MIAGECVKVQAAGVGEWDGPQMREDHAKCVRLYIKHIDNVQVNPLVPKLVYNLPSN